jgi:hypothetical protein
VLMSCRPPMRSLRSKSPRNHLMAMLSNFAARLVGEITPLLGNFQPSILVVWAFDLFRQFRGKFRLREVNSTLVPSLSEGSTAVLRSKRRKTSTIFGGTGSFRISPYIS